MASVGKVRVSLVAVPASAGVTVVVYTEGAAQAVVVGACAVAAVACGAAQVPGARRVPVAALVEGHHAGRDRPFQDGRHRRVVVELAGPVPAFLSDEDGVELVRLVCRLVDGSQPPVVRDPADGDGHLQVKVVKDFKIS